jgi:ferredoxin-NADP reductase
MNIAFPVPDEVPPDLYGRRERDPLLRVLERVMNAHMHPLRYRHRKDVAGESIDRSFPVVVVDRAVEAHDENVMGFALAAPDGGELPLWRDPADSRRYRIAVRRIPDGIGSVEMHDEVVLGTRLTIRGPRNAFAFAVPGHGSTADHLHFVAGGIGITPILPMVRLAHRLGVDWTMVYTGRSRDSLPFLGELREFGDNVTIRTDDVDGTPSAAVLLEGARSTSAIYACGPMPMIGTLDRGVARGTEFHFERFSASPIVDGVQFDVELARTGETVTVPADRSALDAIRTVRPDVAYSCRQGFCGTCRVPVVGGTDGMLVCTERTQGERVVLDI